MPNEFENKSYDNIKDKYFWYFIMPDEVHLAPRFTFTKKEVKKFFGLIKETVTEVTSDEGCAIPPHLLEFAEDAKFNDEIPNGEVKFYLGDDGIYYLDLFDISNKHQSCGKALEEGIKPINYGVDVKWRSEAYGLVLPNYVSGDDSLWVFNKFGANFKDLEAFWDFNQEYFNRTGNYLFLVEA